jgi:SulP family sulfate permease
MISLVLVGVGVGAVLLQAGGDASFGPSSIDLPSLDTAALLTALTVLVIPQAPLTFANSCLATADAAGTYFGERARRVRPGRLATTIGGANLFAGTLSGMPVCHGAGGMTAHYAFGARTAAAPLAMGGVLLALALGVGAGLAGLLAAFPLPILAGLLSAAGVLHIGLLRDLSGTRDWLVALAVGGVGFAANLSVGLALGLALWWLPRGTARLRAATA